jgi:hypothetical protein
MSATSYSRPAGTARGRRRIVAVYNYTDESGKLLYQVLRYEPKGFSQRRPDGRGGWVPNLNGVKRVLYNLPAILRADTIYITEGEKDGDALAAWGLAATTNSGGAGKWRCEYSNYLAQKRVVLLPDADEPGRRHALAVARSVLKVCTELKLIELPGAKDTSDWIAAGGTREDLDSLVNAAPPADAAMLDAIEACWFPPPPTPAEPPEDGAALVRDAEDFIAALCILPPSTGLPLVLWAVATHAFAALEPIFDSFAYVQVKSPVPRCGKTRLLETIEMLAHEPLRSSNISEAALFRLAGGMRPTLLLDEMDDLNSKSERAAALRALLNAGHRRGSLAYRCAGPAHDEVVAFDSFCPKAIAGLGGLPPALRDRCIVVEMQRRPPDQRPARLNQEARQRGAALQQRAARWFRQNAADVRVIYDNLDLAFLEDREADCWSPLFAVLSIADPARLDELRSDAECLAGAKSADEESQPLSLQLLEDLRAVWPDGADKLQSQAAVELLRQLEERPWGEMTKRKLSQALKRFSIRSRELRVGGVVARGYYRDDLEAAWARYLPSRNATSATSV